MSDDPNVSAVWRDARGSLDVLFEHTCCYDREEFNAVIESVRVEERERIARNIEAKTGREVAYTLGGNSAPTDAQQSRAGVIAWFGKTTARIAREGA